MRYVALFLMILPALSGCEKDAPPIEAQPRPVLLYTVEPSPQTESLRFVGRVEAARTVDLAFDSAGTIEILNIQEGEEVAAGQLLAQLDTRTLQLAVRHATAELELARQELARIESLRARDMLPQSSLDEARTRVELLDIERDSARKALEDATLTAPFDARIMRRHVENHAAIEAAEPVVKLMPLGEIEIVAAIPEQVVSTVEDDRVEQISARFQADPGTDHPLRLSEYAAEANADTQTFDVRFALQNIPRWRLLPGMTAAVTITLTALSPSTITVPLSAVQADADGSLYVWKIEANGRDVRRQPVSTCLPDHDRVSVTAGLVSGDQIVAAGGQWLLEGMQVRPLNDSPSDNL